MITRLHVGNSLTNRLDVTGTLMTKDNGESTLGVLARECVCVGMADTSVVDLDTDFVGARGQNLDFLNGEVLASFPGHCGLLLLRQPCFTFSQHNSRFMGFGFGEAPFSGDMRLTSCVEEAMRIRVPRLVMHLELEGGNWKNNATVFARGEVRSATCTHLAGNSLYEDCQLAVQRVA